MTPSSTIPPPAHGLRQLLSKFALPGQASAGAVSNAAADVPLDLPDSIVTWLANLALLYGVPFEYLVPDARLLPNESIRFFYVDPNWIRRAIDGVLSLGATSTRENVFNQAFFEQIYAAVQARIPQVRQDVRGVPQPAKLTVGATISGFLFRSAIVSGYPGIEVVPTFDCTPVPILRMDRLSSDVMLVLFNGVPDRIEIRQPSEGLHFGIVRNPPGGNTFTMYLRWLGHTTQANDVAGQQILTNPPNQQSVLTIPAPMRTSATNPPGTTTSPGVVDVTGAVAAAVGRMGTTYLGPDGVFTSAEFAVEMVLAAGVQPWAVNVSAPPCPGA